MLCDDFSTVGVDKCAYTKLVDGECMIISLYVDDLLIFGTSIQLVHRTKNFLVSKFDMKDMGEASAILGVKIIKNDERIMLSQ